MIEANNVFYVSNFNTIGGVETYIYELSRKYKNYDITVVYKTGDDQQIKRLKKYVRVIKYDAEIIKCKKFFCNYETDIIENVEAEEYIQLIHAMFKTQGLTPRIHPKITKYFCVSENAGREWEELTGFKPTLCRNPLTITEEEKEPVLYLISATRLTAEKGKNRMIKLGEMLNASGINYLWLVFTSDVNKIKNPNIIYLEPRLNIRPFIASIKGKGYGVQLSNCEGDCYFTRECEALGVPLIVTPIPSFKEQGLVDGKNCYYIPFDMKEVDIKKIATKIPSYDPYQKGDTWSKELVKGESQYQKDLKTMVYVQCITKYHDLELNELKTPDDDPYKVNKVRAEELEKLKLVRRIKNGKSKMYCKL